LTAALVSAENSAPITMNTKKTPFRCSLPFVARFVNCGANLDR